MAGVTFRASWLHPAKFALSANFWYGIKITSQMLATGLNAAGPDSRIDWKGTPHVGEIPYPVRFSG